MRPFLDRPNTFFFQYESSKYDWYSKYKLDKLIWESDRKSKEEKHRHHETHLLNQERCKEYREVRYENHEQTLAPSQQATLHVFVELEM